MGAGIEHFWWEKEKKAAQILGLTIDSGQQNVRPSLWIDIGKWHTLQQ